MTGIRTLVSIQYKARLISCWMLPVFCRTFCVGPSPASDARRSSNARASCTHLQQKPVSMIHILVAYQQTMSAHQSSPLKQRLRVFSTCTGGGVTIGVYLWSPKEFQPAGVHVYRDHPMSQTNNSSLCTSSNDWNRCHSYLAFESTFKRMYISQGRTSPVVRRPCDRGHDRSDRHSRVSFS